MTTTKDNDIHQLKDAMNHALIQAIRASSDQGDYIMIRNIVHAAIDYSTAFGNVYGYDLSTSMGTEHSNADANANANTNGAHVSPVTLLEARLFGEAIDAMGKTKAGHGKLKKVWTTFMNLAAGCGSESDSDSDSDGSESKRGLASKASAFELNAMIGALGKRGKVRAALKIYQTVTDGTGTDSVKIVGDEYTASALLIMLANSIEADDVPRSLAHANNAHSDIDGGNGKGNSKSSVTLSSPCWQWNEAISILDDFEKRIELNNQVYAAALKVNEQAMVLYKFPGNKHPGAKCAMSILERMQVRCIGVSSWNENLPFDSRLIHCLIPRNVEFLPMLSLAVSSCQHLTKVNSGKRHWRYYGQWKRRRVEVILMMVFLNGCCRRQMHTPTLPSYHRALVVDSMMTQLDFWMKFGQRRMISKI